MWRVQCWMPTEEFIISRLYMPRWVDGIVPMAGLRAPLSQYPKIFVEAAVEPDQCVVTPNHVNIKICKAYLKLINNLISIILINFLMYIY